MITVRHHILENGTDPFANWLDALKDTRGKAKIQINIDRMSLGNFGNCKGLSDGISELKIDFGPGYRVYYGRIGSLVILLLCGGDKGSQKKDIITAKKHWLEYKKGVSK